MIVSSDFLQKKKDIQKKNSGPMNVSESLRLRVLPPCSWVMFTSETAGLQQLHF